MALFSVVAAFVVTFLLGRVSLMAGLGSVLAVGYFYGVVRANLLSTYTHFLFDAAVLGFYLSQLGQPLDGQTIRRMEPLWGWVKLLIGWVLLMCLIPIQHPLVQLVGLRGNAFLVPFLLVGGRLQGRQLIQLALLLAALNVVALGFAGAEFILGVERFYPLSPVTELIYRSNDASAARTLRIPATFVNAHAYAGTMAITLPWLMWGWVLPRLQNWQRILLTFGIGAALMGVFLSATRVNVGMVFMLLLLTTISGKLRGGLWLAWLVLLGGLAYTISSTERMQRFLTLTDTERVVGRIGGSVNLSFWELIWQYPMGNGLGGGGTSIPFFLQHLINNPIGMENEYSRILLEQGLPGLVLWIGFIVWLAFRPAPPRTDPWWLGWRLLWYATLACFALAVLGTGLMTAIPQTPLFFIGAGLLGSYESATRAAPRPSTARNNARNVSEKLDPPNDGGERA